MHPPGWGWGAAAPVGWEEGGHHPAVRPGTDSHLHPPLVQRRGRTSPDGGGGPRAVGVAPGDAGAAEQGETGGTGLPGGSFWGVVAAWKSVVTVRRGTAAVRGYWGCGGPVRRGLIRKEGSHICKEGSCTYKKGSHIYKEGSHICVGGSRVCPGGLTAVWRGLASLQGSHVSTEGLASIRGVPRLYEGSHF